MFTSIQFLIAALSNKIWGNSYTSLNQSHVFIHLKSLLKITLLFCLIHIISACSKNSSTPNGPNLPDIELQPHSSLLFDSKDIRQTETGFSYAGPIRGVNTLADTFAMATGEFELKTDTKGNITSFTGVGIPKFPDTGIFSKLLESYLWEAVQARITYETGKYFKETSQTDIPLNDNRYYLHFSVFDESNDQNEFKLRHRGNKIIFDFVDFYLDPDDPAVFFKTQLPTSNLYKELRDGLKEGKGVAEQLYKKIWEKIKITGLEDLIDLIDEDPVVIYGFSNQAFIESETYKFSDLLGFEELFGYSGFESFNSHFVEIIKNVPIPKTYIGRASGFTYLHAPVAQFGPSPGQILADPREAFLSWMNDPLGQNDDSAYLQNFVGSVDIGGKGIGAILGVLQGQEDLFGFENVVDDINLDLVGATLQIQRDKDGSSFFRLGIQANDLLLDALVAARRINKLLKLRPRDVLDKKTAFMYLSIENELENWLLYIEGVALIENQNPLRHRLPPLLQEQYIMKNAYSLMNKDSVKVHGLYDLDLGFASTTIELGGAFSTDGFELEGDFQGTILLPNGVELVSGDMKAKISNDKLPYLEGSLDFPYGNGITATNVTGEYTTEDGFVFAGSITSDIVLDNGLVLTDVDLTFKTSTNPDEGIELAGSIRLPHGLGFAEVEGELTTAGISLSGELGSTIKIGGHDFLFTNSTVTVSSQDGVFVNGIIDLYAFKVFVSGEINPDGSFEFKGSKSLKTNLVDLNMNITVRPSGITITGNGCITVVSIQRCGDLTFEPNWNNKTIKVCKGIFCITIP